MSDKEKLEDEAPKTASETTEDDFPEVEGHIKFKGAGNLARDPEVIVRAGEFRA